MTTGVAASGRRCGDVSWGSRVRVVAAQVFALVSARERCGVEANSIPLAKDTLGADHVR